jgi:hypothetical protein
MSLLKAALVMAAIIGFLWLMIQAAKGWAELFGEYAFLSAMFVLGTLVLWAGQLEQ